MKATKELLIFITPTVVDNPDENDLNFNADERERLDVLSKPINSDMQRLVEKNRLLLPEKAGGETVNPLAPIEPNITPNGK